MTAAGAAPPLPVRRPAPAVHCALAEVPKSDAPGTAGVVVVSGGVMRPRSPVRGPADRVAASTFLAAVVIGATAMTVPILTDDATGDYVDPLLAALAILAVVAIPVLVASALTWCGIAWHGASSPPPVLREAQPRHGICPSSRSRPREPPRWCSSPSSSPCRFSLSSAAPTSSVWPRRSDVRKRARVLADLAGSALRDSPCRLSQRHVTKWCAVR